MTKILSQAGISLADMYDVEGSVAGIEQLNSEDVALVHDMGETIFSERFSGTIRRRVTGDIAQSLAFNQNIDDFPAGAVRILDVTVLNAAATTVARLSTLVVSQSDVVAGREVPIWVWNGAVDLIRITENGGAVAAHELLGRELDTNGGFPKMLVGGGQPQRVSNIVIRGDTLAFGAGTIELIVLIQILFSQVGGISSIGLPIPSW